MRELKLFDKTQLLIAIFAVASFITSIIFFFIMSFTSKTLVDEEGLSTIVYDPTLQGIYSFFTFAHILGIVWFVARIITYKLRLKEADTL